MKRNYNARNCVTNSVSAFRDDDAQCLCEIPVHKTRQLYAAKRAKFDTFRT